MMPSPPPISSIRVIHSPTVPLTHLPPLPKEQLRIEDIDAVSKEEFIDFASNLLFKQTRSLEFYLVS